MSEFLCHERKTCALCGGSDIDMILKMPPSQPVDGFREKGHQYQDLPRFPMDLHMCNTCGHVQLMDIVDPNILYGSYIYKSSSSPDLHKHFAEYADYLNNNIGIRSDTKVLDIGSNDGLFLSQLRKYTKKLYGVDPAPNIISDYVDKKIHLHSGYCTTDELKNFSKKEGEEYYDLITANNVFAHAENLDEMLRGISHFMAEEGRFCFEVSYLYDMIKGKVLDYIYHEHLSYHSVKSLIPFLKKHGLYIIDITIVKTKGGSIRVLCGKEKNKENNNLIRNFIDLESSIGCDNKKNLCRAGKLLG